MRKRIEPTIVEKAIQTVDGFEKVYKMLQQQVTLRGQSQSTLGNYIRRIALISLHFQRLPEQVSDDEINEYLTGLALSAKSPSRSSFKHAVYGLRYYFRLIGQNKRAIALPSLKKDAKLPVILNRSELKELFKAPTLLKQRIVLTLIYSAGLRGQEVIYLKLSDIVGHKQCYQLYSTHQQMIDECDREIEKQLTQQIASQNEGVIAEIPNVKRKVSGKNKVSYNLTAYLKEILGIDVTEVIGISELSALA
ncbi:MAG: phage integrase N-terminal SAM-like domain-containing protein, partial [Bacteroidota bacterium]|nr:phage integrase N-terminal SAM-like domain-containing protein [Bacteroidota bacterium]